MVDVEEGVKGVWKPYMDSTTAESYSTHELLAAIRLICRGEVHPVYRPPAETVDGVDVCMGCGTSSSAPGTSADSDPAVTALPRHTCR